MALIKFDCGNSKNVFIGLFYLVVILFLTVDDSICKCSGPPLWRATEFPMFESEFFVLSNSGRQVEAGVSFHSYESSVESLCITSTEERGFEKPVNSEVPDKCSVLFMFCSVNKMLAMTTWSTVIPDGVKNTWDVIVMRYKILCCCYMPVFNTSSGSVSSQKY